MTQRFFDVNELHDATFTAPTFLIEPLFPTGGIAMLHGPKTAGKTQLSLALACNIAKGTPFLGEYATRTGKVLMVEVDMPVNTFQERVKRVNDARSLCYYVGTPFDVLTAIPGDLRAIGARPWDLVVVDSLRKTHAGDENDSKTPSAVYQAWRKLFPGAALLFQHHDRKKPTNPNAYLHREESQRGTGAWLDDIDFGMQLEKVRGAGGHHATLTFSKVREGEEPPPLALQMNTETLLLEPSKPSTRFRLVAWKAANPTATRDDAVAWLQEAGICGRSVAYKVAAEVYAK